MSGYNVAVWSALILAEVLAISVVLNIVWRRRWWQSKSRRGLHALTPFVAEIAAKAKAIKEIYRQVVDGTAADVTALMANVSAQEQEIESLLQSRISDLPSNQQTTDLLQSLWDDMRDGHAVLSTFTDALLGKAKLFHEFMEKMAAQEQLLEELTELSTTYKQDLKDLASEPQAQQSIQEILNGLSKNYQSLQIKINELSANNQEILMKNNYYHTFSDQYRAFFETLQNLKIDNLRMSEKLRMQEPKLEWLRREKACVEEEIERLKGLDEAHRASRRKAAHLEEQLQRANEENQRLKGELTALTAEYLKLFERQST